MKLINVDTVELEDLGFTQEEWRGSTKEEKDKAVREYCFALPEQPYWLDDTYTEGD